MTTEHAQQEEHLDQLVEAVISVNVNNATLTHEQYQKLKGLCWRAIQRSIKSYVPDRGSLNTWIHTNLHWTVRAFLTKSQSPQRRSNVPFEEAIKPPKAMEDT